MTSPEIISRETNAALRDAAGKYCASITIPCYINVDGFAGAILEEVPVGAKTLVTGTPDSLAVTVHDDEDKTKAFVNIDLDAPDQEVASFVAPGLYNDDGEWDNENGTFKRPVIRPLTEAEGLELTLDLYSIIAKIPAERRASE